MKLSIVTSVSLLALLAAGAAQAAVSTVIQGRLPGNSLPYTHSECAGCVDAFAETVVGGGIGYSNTSTLALYARADYGVLKASSAVEGAGPWAAADGASGANFYDSFQIDAPGLTGKLGYFTARVAMPFSASVQNPTGSIGAGLNMWLIVNPYNDVTEGYSLFANEGGAAPSSLLVRHNNEEVAPNAPMILTVPFFYGVPISIRAGITTTALGQLGMNGGSFSAVADAAHSLYWQGIDSMTDNSGNAVTGFTLTSDSGTDWSRSFAPAPVPEPSTVLLMLAGLGLVAVRWRRASGLS